MKTIKTNNVELLLVKVPSGNRTITYSSIDIPSNYQIVNTLSNLTDEQAKGLVEDSDYHAKCYKKYDTLKSQNETKEFLTVIISCDTAIESFHSLMAVNEVYLVNPYSKLPPSEPVISFKDIDEAEFIGAEYKVELNQWQQAENNTSEYLILKKQ